MYTRLLIGLAVLAAAVWLLWPEGHRQPPRVLEARVAADGLVIRLDRAIAVDRVRIREESGGVLLAQRLGGVRRSSLRLHLSWPRTGAYLIHISGPRGELRHRVRVADKWDQPLSVRLLAPYDGADSAAATGENDAVVAAGGMISCALVISNTRPVPSRVSGRVSLSPGLELLPDNLPGWVEVERNGAGVGLVFSHRLQALGEDLALVFRVRSRQEGHRSVSAVVIGGRPEDPEQICRLSAGLDFLSPTALAAKIEVAGHWLPTGMDGLFDRRKQAGTIYYRSPVLRRLARWLGVTDDRASYWMPYTFQSLTLVNNFGSNLALLIKSRITGLNDGRTPGAFIPPDIYTGSQADNTVTAAVIIPPGRKQRVVLPIFITAPPRPGHYRRQVTIYPMGGDRALKTLDLPLHVTGMDHTALICTLASLAVSVLALSFLACRFKRLLGGLKVRQVVIVALFGSLTFAGVNLPIKVFGALFHGLLGPFSVLVTGFFSELLYYAFLVALIRTIPRPGVVSLLTLVRYLLAVLVTGGFHLTDFLYVGTSIAVKETALYLAGVTRVGEGFKWTWSHVSLLALLLALGDALLGAASIYVHMVLFRLYFADWYIGLNIIVNGLIYTALGVWLGKVFSDRLVWAEE